MSPPPADGRRRIAIGRLQPAVDRGRFPIKRTVGDPVTATVDMFADGHDAIAGVLRFRRVPPGDASADAPWIEIPLTSLGNDSWTATFAVMELGEYEGNAWDVTIEELGRYFEHVAALPDVAVDRDEARGWAASASLAPPESVVEAIGPYLSTADVLGRRTGELHVALAISEGDIVIIDFEGEPARPLAERRAKCSPLRDVAGMLRSFSYAALTGLGAATQTRPEDVERLAPWAELWEVWTGAAFLRAYRTAAEGARFLPSDADDFELLLHAFALDKAMYELGYELNNRPDWVHRPLTGLMRLRLPLHA